MLAIKKRVFRRLVVMAAIVVSFATAAAYFGMRVGRRYERNHQGGDIPRWHNLAVSVRETLGLLEFPSQIGQDRWVAEKVFRGVDDGYFLDVGSGDGYTRSNTWALDQRGWNTRQRHSRA